MKRYLLVFVMIFLLAFVCLGGVFLFRYANANLTQVATQEQSVNINTELNESKKSDSWVDGLASLPPREYILATNEIFIEFKSEAKKPQTKSVYQLLIDKNDIYSMFCLSQTLKNISVDFSVIKENLNNLIYINTQDKNILNRVVEELKAYDIHSQIMEIKL